MAEQPGCVVAIAHKDRIVLERAFGCADPPGSVPLTPRHRLRIASHCKSFTAGGVMKLREQGRLSLDDAVGQYSAVSLRASPAPPLPRRSRAAPDWSVTEGLGSVQRSTPVCRCADADRRPRGFAVNEPNTRFKYSNHGFGLVGLVIETVTGEPLCAFIKREVIDAAGLKETHRHAARDGRADRRGHSGKRLLGHRIAIPGDYPTNAISPAGGGVSTARDPAHSR